MWGKSVYQIGARMNRIEREKRRRNPRPLKPSTIKRYSVEQIYRHLDRFCSAIGSDQWQIDFQYNVVRRWDADQGVYLRWSSTHDYSRPAAIEALYRTYYARFIDDDDFQFDDTFYYDDILYYGER